MANNTLHQVSVNFTVDQRDAVEGFQQYERSIQKLLRVQKILEASQGDTTAIKAEIKELRKLQLELAKTGKLTQGVGKVTKKMQNDMNAATEGNGKFSQSIGQAAFGVEDFFAGFETGGLKGGLRGAANNFSMVARILAGPLTGGLLGIGLVSLPLVIKMFGEAEDATDDFAESLNKLVEAHKKKVEQFNTDVDQEKRVKTIKEEEKSIEAIKKAIEAEVTAREKLNEELRLNEELKGELGKEAGLPRKGGFNRADLFAEIDWALNESSAGEETAKRLKDRIDDSIDRATSEMETNPERAASIAKILEAEIKQAIGLASEESMVGGLPNPISIAVDALDSTFWDAGAPLQKMLKKLNSGEEDLVKIGEEGLKLLNRRSAIAEELEDSKEREVAHQERLAIEIERELAAAKEKAAIAKDVLTRAGQTPLQATIQTLVDERKKFEEAFDQTFGTPEDQDLLLKAEETSLEKKLKSLEDSLAKNTKVLEKGLAIAGPNKAESAELARISAKAQVDKAADDKDKNKDVVDAINLLKDVLSGKTLLAVPSP